jgi:hypothetical protein
MCMSYYIYLWIREHVLRNINGVIILPLLQQELHINANIPLVTTLISQQEGENLDNVSNILISYVKNVSFKEFIVLPTIPLLVIDDDNIGKNDGNNYINKNTNYNKSTDCDNSDDGDNNDSNNNSTIHNDENPEEREGIEGAESALVPTFGEASTKEHSLTDSKEHSLAHNPVLKTVHSGLVTVDPGPVISTPQTELITRIQSRADQIEKDHVSTAQAMRSSAQMKMEDLILISNNYEEDIIQAINPTENKKNKQNQSKNRTWWVPILQMMENERNLTSLLAIQVCLHIHIRV